MILSALCSSCVGLPYVVPPLRLSAGTGLATVQGAAPALPVVLQAGLNPLGLSRAGTARSFDLGVGYMYQGRDGQVMHGGYLEGGYVLLRQGDADGMTRISAVGQLRLLTDTRSSRLGTGGALRLVLERAQYFSGVYSGPVTQSARPGEPTYPAPVEVGGNVGFGEGEAAIGPYVEAATSVVGDRTGYALTAGLSARTPFLAGFLWRWLWPQSSTRTTRP